MNLMARTTWCFVALTFFLLMGCDSGKSITQKDADANTDSNQLLSDEDSLQDDMDGPVPDETKDEEETDDDTVKPDNAVETEIYDSDTMNPDTVQPDETVDTAQPDLSEVEWPDITDAQPDDLVDTETPDTDTVANTRTYTCDPKPEEGTVWNTVASYQQTWDGTAWSPADSATTYNTTESSTSCHYTCAANYTWDSSTCNADTRTYSCAGLPANARWNTVDSITQTWNGVDWIPSTAGVYNTDSSVIECRYKCDTFYTWVDSACVMASGVLCTGQTLCYNGTMTTTCPVEGVAYYGQDAQYAALGYCIPHDYTVNGTSPQEIVTDNVTGLQWQRTLSIGTYTWTNAVTYCADLDYGGYSDWRLPTAPELETLPDYGRSHPEIDTTIFPDTPSEMFWTSSSVANDSTSAWYVYFANNYMSYTSKTATNIYARCVRGAALPTSSFVETTVGGKVIVTDTTTDLIWTKEYSGSTIWVNALSYCENLDYGGYDDWRLPDFNELKTLIDRTLVAPASSFPGMPTNMFWSSSSSVFYPDSVWLVDFDYGGVNGYPKTNDYYARCVR